MSLSTSYHTQCLDRAEKKQTSRISGEGGWEQKMACLFLAAPCPRGLAPLRSSPRQLSQSLTHAPLTLGGSETVPASSSFLLCSVSPQKPRLPRTRNVGCGANHARGLKPPAFGLHFSKGTDVLLLCEEVCLVSIPAILLQARLLSALKFGRASLPHHPKAALDKQCRPDTELGFHTV